MSLEQVEKLHQAATPAAVTELQTLAETAEDKATVKAAKRALYLLSQKGIAPEPIRAAQPEVKPETHIENLRVYASAYDGEGNSLMLFVEADADGGSPYATQVLVNDVMGVRNFGGGKLSRQELKQRIERFQSQLENGVAFVEIEPDAGRSILQQAQDLHNRIQGLTPRGFAEWAQRIGVQKGMPEITLELPAELAAQTLDDEPSADALFNLPFFETWFLDAQLGMPFLANLMQTGKVGSDSSEEERNSALATVMSQAADETFTPELRAVYAKRLQQSASILWRLDKKDEAALTLAHARKLESDSQSADIAFARTLCERTMWAAYELYRREQQEKENRG